MDGLIGDTSLFKDGTAKVNEITEIHVAELWAALSPDRRAEFLNMSKSIDVVYDDPKEFVGAFEVLIAKSFDEFPKALRHLLSVEFDAFKKVSENKIVFYFRAR